MKKPKLIVTTAQADWKDLQGLADSFKSALKMFGLYVYDDPTWEGSDQYSYLISNHPIKEKDLKKVGLEANGMEEE